METSVKTMFKEIDIDLNDDEKKGRVDIKYKTSLGKHLIIELKRPERAVTAEEVKKQLRKYMCGLEKALITAGNDNNIIEGICVLGRLPKEWTDSPRIKEEDIKGLKEARIRVVLYSELIANNLKAYKFIS